VNNMADRRIIEKEVKLSENKPFEWSLVGEFLVDRLGYRIDDTIGPELDLHWISPKMVPNTELIFVRIPIQKQYNRGERITVFERQIALYDRKECPILQRYRVPFWQFEVYGELALSPASPMVCIGPHPDAPIPPTIVEQGTVYIGNPNVDLSIGERVQIWVLSPWKLDLTKSRAVLQLVELHGHVGPKSIRVE